MSITKKRWPRLFAVGLMLALLFLISPSALADTNGQELKITEQPDRLVVNLGAEWASVHFELKLDSGTFPVPVVVSDDGVLIMDLGGSKTYTLTCLTAGAPPPIPASEVECTEATPSPETERTDPPSDDEQDEDSGGLSTGTVVIFLIGLVVAVGGLVAMYFFKRRQEYYDDDDYDDDEE